MRSCHIRRFLASLLLVRDQPALDPQRRQGNVAGVVEMSRPVPDSTGRGLGEHPRPVWTGILSTAPHVVMRSGRRLTQNARLAVEAVSLARSLHRHDEDEPRVEQRHEQATLHSWYAENFCVVNGLTVVPVGETPKTPSLLVGQSLGILDVPVVSSLVRSATIIDQHLMSGALTGAVAQRLGVRVAPIDAQDTLGEVRDVLRSGASVLLIRAEPSLHPRDGRTAVAAYEAMAQECNVDAYRVRVCADGKTAESPILRALKAVASPSTVVRVEFSRLRDRP